MIDAIDREILRTLQNEGRMSATALAAQVGLTVAPCHRRLKDLEASGAISGYRAVINPSSVGLGFEALVFVTLAQVDRDTIDDFEAQVAANTRITSAQRLFGDPDYILKVMARDLNDYQKFYDTELTSLPGVLRLRSTLVMKNLKPGAGLPL
ncbi:Lrp/AsnC family transcriptional regulator [Arthrobacter glacialis]|uniref:AsnC family transcriptional regulator n=1 Tax=Arthrobacter glacialis TaxID=1664 RepID=A0A2S3ZX22_ARTGL|nr:Lrp/AsnC family transcriptional regulator [Arthrobacter glacialis]POH59408.1 AsnC family transcriptional regulator [Arthrobacter glacialis]POH73826.1 AsnC family transcriptional regulator [Arthrobacter glacialis]